MHLFISSQLRKILLFSIFVSFLVFTAGQAIASSSGANHIIILLDQSGTFRDKIELLTYGDEYAARKRLSHFLTNVLPKILKKDYDKFGSIIFDRDRDYVSFYLFGLPNNYPDFRSNYISKGKIKKSFESDFSFNRLKSIPFEEYERGRGKIQNWTVVTAAIPMAICKSGELYRDLKDPPPFSRTFIVRISDEILNKPGMDASEIRDLMKHQRIKGFDYLLDVFRKINSNYVYGVYESSIYLSTNLNQINEDTKTYFLDNKILPIKVLITEVKPIKSFGFYPVFDLIPAATLMRQTDGTYASTINLELSQRLKEFYPDLVPLHYSYKLCGRGIDDEMPVKPLKALQAIYLNGFDRSRFPDRIEVEGSFRLNDRIYGGQIVKVKNKIPVTIEDILYIGGDKDDPVTDEMMGNHPEWSQKKIADYYTKQKIFKNNVRTAIIVVLVSLALGMIIYMLIVPSRPEIEISAIEDPHPVKVDLNTDSRGRVVIGKCRVIDQRKKKPLELRWLSTKARMRKIILQEADDWNVYDRLTLGNDKFYGFSHQCDKSLDDVTVQPEEDLWIMADPESIVDINNMKPSRTARELDIPLTLNWQQKGRAPGSSEPFSIRLEIEPVVAQVTCETFVHSGESNKDHFEYEKGQTRDLGYLLLKDVSPKSFKTPVDIQLSVKLERLDEIDDEFQRDWVVDGITIKKPDIAVDDVGSQLDPAQEDMIHISGKISKEGIQIPLQIDFSKLSAPFPGGDKYRLRIASVRGSEHIQFPKELDSICVLPNKKEAELYLNIKYSAKEDDPGIPIPLRTPSGIKLPAYDIDLYEQKGYIKIDEDALATNPNRSLQLFTLELGNQATSGEDTIMVKVTGSENKIYCSGIKEVKGKNLSLISVETDNEAEEDLVVFNLNRTFSSDSIDSCEKLTFYLKTGKTKFESGAEEGKINATFKITYWINHKDGSQEENIFELRMAIKVTKEPGPQQISVDFGTSAIAVAFAANMGQVLDGTIDDSSECLVPLHEKLNVAAIEEDPYFIPSILNINIPDGNAEDYTISLPASAAELANSPDTNTLVSYLKQHIALNHREINLQNGRKQIRLDELLAKVYDKLASDYFSPLITEKLPDFGKCKRMIITHPNSFLYNHVEFMKECISRGFPQCKFLDSISESDAVTFWYYTYRQKLIIGNKPPPPDETVLIYDIGAGTLDVSLRKIRRHQADGKVGKLESIDLLSMHTLHGAGNRVDQILADLIHRKLLRLTNDLADINFKYACYISGPPPNIPDKDKKLAYSKSLISMKNGLGNLKKDMTSFYAKNKKNIDAVMLWLPFKHSTEPFQFDKQKINKQESEWRKDLPDKYGISLEGRYPKIALKFSDIQAALEPFYKENVDEVLDVVLRNKEGYFEIDTLIFSGRTAQLPGLKERIKQRLGEIYNSEKTIFCPVLDAKQLKAAVSMGALAWAMNSGERELFKKYPIFGVFGIAWYDGNKWSWKTAFRHDESVSSKTIKGEGLPYYEWSYVLDSRFCDRLLFLQSYCASPESFFDSNKDEQSGQSFQDFVFNKNYFNQLAELNDAEIKEFTSLTDTELKISMTSKYRNTRFGEPSIIVKVSGSKKTESLNDEVPLMETDFTASDWWPFNMFQEKNERKI